MKKVAPSTATVMQILQFVRMTEVDPIYLETSYYVAPEESVSRPYALLFEAMKTTEYDALAKVAMHGREHIVILRPAESGIVLHTMYFPDELQKSNRAANVRVKKFDKKEVDLARKLIETLAAPFEPEKFHDEYKENVEKLIENKRTGKHISTIKQPRKAPVIDLMQALQRSLAGTASSSKTARAGKHSPKKTARKRGAQAA